MARKLPIFNMSSPDPVAEYGWSAVPRSHTKVFPASSSSEGPPPLKVSDLPFPDTEIVSKTIAYAKEKLPAETFNHSLRVYYYGTLRSVRILNYIRVVGSGTCTDGRRCRESAPQFSGREKDGHASKAYA